MRLAEREHNGKRVRAKLFTLRTIIIHAYLLLAVFLLCACGTATAAHQYRISLDEAFNEMRVEARFDRPVSDIAARSRLAGKYLSDARDCDSGVTLGATGSTLRVPAAGIRCLSYAIDLSAAERDAGKIVIAPALWMWRPRLRRDEQILATFALPGNSRVFVPWQMLDESGHRYRLVPSPQSGMATAVFGEFQQRSLDVAGAELHIVLLGKRDDVAIDHFLDWIRATANNVESLYGAFPYPQASVLLIPVGGRSWDSDRPVAFGRVVRDGGASIELMIDPDRPSGDYAKDWTATHEFSHLLLPYLDHEQRWISEGFAQYYQNVLLARAGEYAARDAWANIYAGLERGRNSAPDLSPNAAARRKLLETRMKVYWSGAALALLADVELRRRSNDRESLDTVLGSLQRCCLPSARRWSGMDLFRKLDELLDEPLFMSLYQRYADTEGFPDTADALAELGVLIEAGEVRLDDTAALAAVRHAITRAATAH